MFLVLDWQNEEDITILKDMEGTIRFDCLEDATLALVQEWNNTGNIYLKIIEL